MWYSEEKAGKDKKFFLMLCVIVIGVVFIFAFLTYYYAIEPSKAARKYGASPPQDKKHKLEWHDDYASVTGGVQRLPEYRFSPLVEVTQVTQAITDEDLRELFQNTIWPMGDNLTSELGFGKADFIVNSGYHTLIYRKNPQTVDEETLRFEFDKMYNTISYSKQIATVDYSPDAVVPILNKGAEYVGVDLVVDTLAADMEALLSRKFDGRYGYVSLTYKDYDINVIVRIEHTVVYVDSIADTADVLRFVFERTSPTVTFN